MKDSDRTRGLSKLLNSTDIFIVNFGFKASPFTATFDVVFMVQLVYENL